MSKVFVTSDLHFGHDNIIKYCNRPFRNAEEMGEHIIKEWNRRVSDEDTVYLLGDVAMGPKSSNIHYVISRLSRLKGTITVVLGNHDMPVPKFKNKGLIAALSESQVNNVFIAAGLYSHIAEVDGEYFFMSHFPDSTDRPSNAIHLHGHAHTEFASSNITQSLRDRKFDIGVDMYGGPVQLTGDLRFLATPRGWDL